VSEAPIFASLDFVYTPSEDVAADAAYFTDVLGGELVFAVEGMGARVAAVRMSSEGPLVLLTDHVEGERPILVFRVEDLSASLYQLTRPEAARHFGGRRDF
jgi:hypothetical protein